MQSTVYWGGTGEKVMIRIIRDIYLDADDNCYMLVTWDGKTDKKGNPQNAHRRYYSELASLVTGLFKILSRDAIKSLTELSELNTKMTEITTIIADLAGRLDSMVSQAISEDH
jgi:hypothetical protein